jgi:small subunit ribosomal protein S7e
MHAFTVETKERNLIAVENPSGSSDNPYSPRFVDEDGERKLVVPTMFLYPQYATSDMISHFEEDTRLEDHITTMFPPEGATPGWDAKGEYVAGQLAVYAITAGRRLLKVGKKMTLRDVMSAAKDGLEVRDGCLSFVVVPKGPVEVDWVQSFKKDRQSE